MIDRPSARPRPPVTSDDTAARVAGEGVSRDVTDRRRRGRSQALVTHTHRHSHAIKYGLFKSNK